MGNKRITNIESPSNSKDAVNKIYLEKRIEAIQSSFNISNQKQENLINTLFNDLVSRIDKCVEVLKGGVQLEHLRAYFESEVKLEKNRLINIILEYKTDMNRGEAAEGTETLVDEGLISKQDFLDILHKWKIPPKGKYSLMSSTSLQEFITGGAVL